MARDRVAQMVTVELIEFSLDFKYWDYDPPANEDDRARAKQNLDLAMDRAMRIVALVREEDSRRR